MNLRALRKVPRLSWQTLMIATLVVAAFAFDRDLGAITFFGVFLSVLVARGFKGNRYRQTRSRRRTNPTTGLRMNGIGRDVGGFFYGEDLFERNHSD